MAAGTSCTVGGGVFFSSSRAKLGSELLHVHILQAKGIPAFLLPISKENVVMDNHFEASRLHGSDFQQLFGVIFKFFLDLGKAKSSCVGGHVQVKLNIPFQILMADPTEHAVLGQMLSYIIGVPCGMVG